MYRCAAQIQGGNIQHYHNYLLARAKAYQSTKVDWVRDGQGRLNKQTVDKGLLRETETIQKQLAQLFKCEVGPSLSKEILSLIPTALFPRTRKRDILNGIPSLNNGFAGFIQDHE